MSSFRIRPRFRHFIKDTPQNVQERIEIHLRDPHTTIKGQVSRGYIVLKIPQEDEHFWSPQLMLSFEEENGGTVISGLYGPRPSIWALFAYGYAALGILAIFIAIIGTSNMSLGKSSSILWALPLLGGLAVALYIIAQTGQKLGAQQTFTLHYFYQGAIGEDVVVH